MGRYLRGGDDMRRSCGEIENLFAVKHWTEERIATKIHLLAVDLAHPSLRFLPVRAHKPDGRQPPAISPLQRPCALGSLCQRLVELDRSHGSLAGKYVVAEAHVNADRKQPDKVQHEERCNGRNEGEKRRISIEKQTAIPRMTEDRSDGSRHVFNELRWSEECSEKAAVGRFAIDRKPLQRSA